jgi:hypothetical protein
MPMKGKALRAGELDGEGREVLVAEAGRGLATWAAERINFESLVAGAWGTTILRKQVGQLSCPPLALESAVICWPQTGHANLNSLIASPDNSTARERGQGEKPNAEIRNPKA